MSNHAPKTDPVTKVIFLLSALALLGAVYVLVSSLINTYQRNSTKGDIDTTMLVASAADNLKPVGLVATSDAPIAGAAGRPGKEIYDAVCHTCHATGILNSPKFGDKAAWEERASVGIEGLLKVAIAGKGSMPARGGDPSITDDELKNTILYMTKAAGLSLGDESAPKAAEEKPAAEAKTEVASENAPAATSETAAAPIEEPAAAAVVAVADSITSDSAEGKKVYDATCFTCHATGIANSPILGNKEAWAPRIAQGMDVLYTTAINGKGAMPPKGGNLSLDDDTIKAAVNYMVSMSK